MIDVVALGELLIDYATISADSDGYPTMAAHPGGAPANFLAALTKYGKSTAFLGKVGDDTFGHLLLGEVSQCNDDACDNRFNPPMGRFPAIEEDEPAYRLLCTEYPAAK